MIPGICLWSYYSLISLHPLVYPWDSLFYVWVVYHHRISYLMVIHLSNLGADKQLIMSSMGTNTLSIWFILMQSMRYHSFLGVHQSYQWVTTYQLTICLLVPQDTVLGYQTAHTTTSPGLGLYISIMASYVKVKQTQRRLRLQILLTA